MDMWGGEEGRRGVAHDLVVGHTGHEAQCVLVKQPGLANKTSGGICIQTLDAGSVLLAPAESDFYTVFLNAKKNRTGEPHFRHLHRPRLPPLWSTEQAPIRDQENANYGVGKRGLAGAGVLRMRSGWAVSALVREVTNGASMRHRHIVTFIGLLVDPSGGASLLMTDFAPNGSLAALLAAEGRGNEGEAAEREQAARRQEGRRRPADLDARPIDGKRVDAERRACSNGAGRAFWVSRESGCGGVSAIGGVVTTPLVY